MEDRETGPRWLSANAADNPFGVDVFDCREVALGSMSTTMDRSIAETYNALREGDGRVHIGKHPPDCAEVHSLLMVPFDGAPLEGVLHLAAEMEDKWDIFAYEDVLYAARSWTGTLSYAVDLLYREGQLLMPLIHYGRDLAFGQPEIVERQVEFLAGTYLWNTLMPFPIPAVLPSDPVQVSLYGFSNYGRAAQFGAYLDSSQKYNNAR